MPFHKTGDKHSLFNCRRISLTSIPCKIREHVNSSQLANFLESNNFFNPAHLGFRKSFLCETKLLTLIDDLHLILDQSSQGDSIFLDFAKAFDKVTHRLLIHKQSKLNIYSCSLS